MHGSYPVSLVANLSSVAGQQLEDGESSTDEWKDGQFQRIPRSNEDFKRHSNLGSQEEEKKSSQRLQIQHRVSPTRLGWIH